MTAPDAPDEVQAHHDHVFPLYSRPTNSYITSERAKLCPSVLIIEENEEMREHFCQFLSAEFELVVVPNAHEACLVIEQRTFDVIVQDVEHEREMEAVKLLKYLRKCTQDKHVRFIAITGYMLPQGKSVLKRGQYDYHLSKPFTLQRLRELLRHCFEKDAISILNELQFEIPLPTKIPVLSVKEFVEMV